MDYVKCEFCEYQTIKSCIGRHLKQVHGLTVRDNTLKRLGLTEDEIPQCKFCGQPVGITHTLQETCDNPQCKALLHNEKKRLGAIKAVQTQIKKGTYHFLKQNLVRDEDGKSILHKSSAVKANKTRVENGTHAFLSENLVKDENGKSILHRQTAMKKIENGTHPWLKENLQRDAEGLSVMHKTTERNVQTSNLSHENLLIDADGKSILHKKIAATRKLKGNLHGNREHNEDYNEKFIREHFIQDGRFDLKGCCAYFNMTVSPINVFKRDHNIIEPNEISIQKLQTEIFDYIHSVYDGEIRANDRDIIHPQELDIVVPEKKLAIEFDGLNYHSQGINCKGINVDIDKNYHLQKTLAAEKAGYQLLHIFENEWVSPVKKEIWKSVICNKLGVSRRIYARKTVIQHVPNDLMREFLASNHLQGSINSLISIGLYYENKLISLMTFGRSRFDKSSEYELLRFCNKCGYTVVGGASKLLSYFKENWSSNIVSYANRRWSNGNLYRALGFKDYGDTPPDYFYFKPEDKELKHRMSFQKGKLKDIPGFVFDEERSETDNMFSNGYMRIYDCGNLKFILD